MKSITARFAVLSILILQHGASGPLVAAEETLPTGPHCHILRPFSALYEDLLVDEKGNALDSVEKCKQYRKGRPGWKGFFKAHYPHCTINSKDERSISDKYACAAAGGVMNDRMHVVRP